MFKSPEMLSIQEVVKLTTLSKTTIYALVAKQEFPEQIRLTHGGRVAWVASEVHEWIAGRCAERDTRAERHAQSANDKVATRGTKSVR